MKNVSLMCAVLIAMLFFSCVLTSVDDGSRVYEEGYFSLPILDSFNRMKQSDENIYGPPDYVTLTYKLFGFIPIAPRRDATEICRRGSEPVQITHEWNIGHGIWTALAWGIWHIQTLKIWCS